MMERSGAGLREQKDRAAQETCVNLGAEFRVPVASLAFSLPLFSTPLVLTSTSAHSFDLDLLSTVF